MSSATQSSKTKPSSGLAGTGGPHVAFSTAPKGSVHKSARTAILRAENVHKSYHKGQLEVPVLKGVDFHVHSGEFVAIVGSSGSGKSTLMHLLGTLDEPNEGKIFFDDTEITGISRYRRDRFRRIKIGLIFQFYHLLPELTALENVLMPAMINMSVWEYFSKRKAYRDRALELLESVGLSHRLRHKPSQLSGGEMQRAAIARALLATPEVLLADEPTGNLDEKTGGEVFDVLCRLREKENLTIVMVTHDNALARQADRTVRLVDGVTAV
jgi:lipoprotein-releasing system ATP-binding protein